MSRQAVAQVIRQERIAAKKPTQVTLSDTELRLQAIYGPTMLLDEVAEVLGFSVGSIYTLRSIGRFPIPLFTGGRRKLIAFTREVAEHLERQRNVQLRADAALIDSLTN